MIKHVFNDILVWNTTTEAAAVTSLCEKCGQIEGLVTECKPMKVSTGSYDPKYLDKALKALAKAV